MHIYKCIRIYRKKRVLICIEEIVRFLSAYILSMYMHCVCVFHIHCVFVYMAVIYLSKTIDHDRRKQLGASDSRARAKYVCMYR